MNRPRLTTPRLALLLVFLVALVSAAAMAGAQSSQPVPAEPTPPTGPPPANEPPVTRPACFDELPSAARAGAWTCVEDYTVRLRDREGRVFEGGPKGSRLIEPSGEVIPGPPVERVVSYAGATFEASVSESGSIQPRLSRSSKRINEVIFRRLVNAYIWEFGANVYYGQGSTIYGYNYETGSVNMNGRQARIDMALAYRTGGVPIAPRLSWQCRTYVADEVCAQNGANSASYTFGSYSIPQQTTYHGSNGKYYYRFFWKFLAQNRPGPCVGLWINPKEASAILTCGNFTPGACQFRDGPQEAKPVQTGC